MTRQPITDAERAARRKAQSSARHAKRRAQWLAALAEAGWTESQYMTAVIRKRVTLPTRRECEECGSGLPYHFAGCSKHPD